MREANLPTQNARIFSGTFFHCFGEAGHLGYHKTTQARQDEAQENRRRDRNEDFTTEIKGSDNKGCAPYLLVSFPEAV